MLLHERFVRVAKDRRDSLFIADGATKRRITYRRGLIASLILSRKLRRFGSGRIGIMIPTSAPCVLSMLGALMSGRTPVMINYATGAAANARYAQERCGFSTIVTARALLDRLGIEPCAGMVAIEDIVSGVTLLEKLVAAAIAALPSGIIMRLVHRGDEEDTAIVLFTSGSERSPKVVPLTHRNIVSNVEAMSRVFELSPNDSVLATLPLFHVFGQTANLWIAIHLGLSLATWANPLDYRAVCRVAREERSTIMVGTPSFFRGYLNASEEGDFSTIRIAAVGADRCPDALREGYLRRHGLTLLEGYGTTETSPTISVNTKEANRPGSVGRPLPGVRVRIEHLESGDECAAGETGRILVQGDLVMKGYLGDLEATSHAIRNGWYDTGDMGNIDADGFLWLEGRLRRFVKIGGEMISLTSVESVLDDLLPEDVLCCVVGIPDPVKGSRILAVVTQDVDAKPLLKRELPPIALPKEFITMEDLPMTGAGTVDFQATTAWARERLVGRIDESGRRGGRVES